MVVRKAFMKGVVDDGKEQETPRFIYSRNYFSNIRCGAMAPP